MLYQLSYSRPQCSLERELGEIIRAFLQMQLITAKDSAIAIYYLIDISKSSSSPLGILQKIGFPSSSPTVVAGCQVLDDDI